MDIKYRPYEEELPEGQKRRRGKKAVILKDYTKASKEKILLLTNKALMNGVSKKSRGKMKNLANAQLFRLQEKLKFKMLESRIINITSELLSLEDDPELIRSTINRLLEEKPK